MIRSPCRPDAGLLLLAAVLFLRLAWLGPRLLVDDLDLAYPFAGGDAWDWIGNGLYLAGEDVRTSGRPPLVPLLVAGLAAVGRVEWLPLLVQALWTATLLVLYRLLRGAFAAPVALAAVLVVAASQALNGLSLEIGADLAAACLLLLALGALAAAGERPRWYAAAGGLTALAYLASPVGLAAAAAGAAAVAGRRRRHLREPALWLGAAMVAAAVAGWEVARRALLAGDPPLHAVRRLLRLHLDDLDGTLWTAAVVVGWPALALAAAGTVVALGRVARRRDPGDLRLLALVAAALPLAFFALVYDFPDRRFLAYPALPAAVLVAEGLAALRPAAARALAGVAAVVWAAWPLPPPVPHALPVAPPSLYAEARTFATREGGLGVEPATARLRRRPVGEVAEQSWWRRVARAAAAGRSGPEERAARRQARQRARRAAAVSAGVLFLDSAPYPFDRYRAQSQLGNVLGRRVRFVPDDLFRRRWPWLAAGGVAPVAEVGDYTLWTVAPPGLGGRWLLATQAAASEWWPVDRRPSPAWDAAAGRPPAGRPRAADAAPPPRRQPAGPSETRAEAADPAPSIGASPAAPEAAPAVPPPSPPPTAGGDEGAQDDAPPPFLGQAPAGTVPPPPVAEPPGRRARRAAPPPGRGDAHRLAAALPGRTRLVALLLPEGPVPPLAVWLPFLLDTTELYVLDEGAVPADLFAPAPGAAPRRFGAARLVERRWRGEPVWVIDFPAGARSEP